ncbi:unnamed protein product [Dibothriocephalus latus]|uniref:Reverse transcriptase domain-containing protein n=1 Tax=Dibothriocephalus latus TaxID=60516 RepID=A0A3P7MEX8_DIBLA|nr:unnamed protein product [Dibothriocephalus latus]
MVQWNRKWKMQVNVQNTELVVFNTTPSERKGVRAIEVDGLQIIQRPTAKFLGVVYDSGLTFDGHTDFVLEKAQKLLNMMRALGGTTWAWRPEGIKKVYTACARPVIENKSAAWMPWICRSRLDRLERLNLKAARTTTIFPI